MEESTAVSDAELAFYEGINANAIERLDEIVSASPATLVIGTAPGEWVTERPRMLFGFEAEGLTTEPEPKPIGCREGTMGCFVDEPRYGLPGGGRMRTRLTAVVVEEVQELQTWWASYNGRRRRPRSRPRRSG